MIDESRRRFLARAGALGLGATALALERRAHAAAVARTIQLEARAVSWELGPGRTVKALAYDGRVPGPELRAREGERVRVVFTNRLAEPTTVHWHGVDVPNAMDGVPEVTQPPIAPGASFVYDFEARPAGTRWYHTHVNEHVQLPAGLAGAFVVEPATPDAVAVDRDVTLVLSEWVTGAAPPLAATREGTAGGRGSMGGMMGGMRPGMGGMMMGGGHQPAHDTVTINGKAWPAGDPLRVKRGERLRLRFVNAGGEHTHVLRVGGHRLAVTHTDGNPLAAPVEVDALPIAPSERYDAVLVADRPGAWFLYCTQPGHAAAGERMAVLYDGHDGRRPDEPDLSLDGLRFWQYGLGQGRPILPAATGAARSFPLVLSAGLGQRGDLWTVNGKTYPDTAPLDVGRGDRVRVRFTNRSAEAHPMHLHGQSFAVLAVNGERAEAPLIKDTVDVDGHMGAVIVEFTAHNPGRWFLHCHKPSHMEGGMISLVRIA